MKKSLGLKICAGIAAFSAIAFLPSTASAVNTSIKVDGVDIFVSGPNSVESNDDNTATYYGDTKTLILDGYTGGAINTDIDSLVIQVLNNSEITAVTNGIKSTGNVTITVNDGKQLKSAGNIDVTGNFALSSGTLDLGAKDLKVTDGNIKIDGAIKAANITLNDTNSASQAKISINDGASVEVTKSIKANYNFAATEKGIVLGNKICASPAAEVSNVTGTGSSKATTTTFTTSELTSGVTDGIKLSAAACSATGEEGVDNPDTLDAIYVYAAILVASSAILGYRRYIAKR